MWACNHNLFRSAELKTEFPFEAEKPNLILPPRFSISLSPMKQRQNFGGTLSFGILNQQPNNKSNTLGKKVGDMSKVIFFRMGSNLIVGSHRAPGPGWLPRAWAFGLVGGQQAQSFFLVVDRRHRWDFSFLSRRGVFDFESQIGWEKIFRGKTPPTAIFVN